LERLFFISDTCDPRTPPLGLNLPTMNRGPWDMVRSGRSGAQIPSDRQRDGRQRRGSGPIRPDPVDLAENIGAQRPPQIHRTDVRAPNNCSSCSSWRTNRHGCAPIFRARQPQHDHETRTRIDNIVCYQWPKDRLTRPRVPPISGQTAQFRGKSTGIRRPRTPCRPAGAWAMFLTNSCHKNDMGYNYVIAGLFRGPDP
jgi:hypothetical protein